MDRALRFSILLVVVGLVGGLATVGAGVTESNVDTLVTAFVLLISGGLGLTGALWLRRPTVSTLYARVPGETLVVLGVTAIIGGLASFRPLSPSVTQGLRVMIAGILVLVGTGLVLGGWRWARRQQMRYPLGLLAAGLAVGLSYIAHQRFDIAVSNSVGVLVVVAAVVLAVMVTYVVPARPSNSIDR